MIRASWRNVALFGASTAALLLACGGNDALGNAGDDVFDEEPDAAYQGPGKGGPIPPLDGGSSFEPNPELDDASLATDATTPCCTVAFAVADATGTEPIARLRGDFAPLDGDGLPLVWSDGGWRATACIPIDTYLRYRFYFGPRFEDPETDGGAIVDDVRVNPDLPTLGDGNGGAVNVLEAFTTCPDAASFVFDAGVDAGPPTSGDGIQNGTETDVDCGGGEPTNASACGVGLKCLTTADCAASVCTTQGFCSTAGHLYAGEYAGDALRGISTASAAGAVANSSATVAEVGGIASDALRATVYTASFGDDAIYAFGQTLSAPAARTLGGISQPWGLAVDPAADRLYATSLAGSVAIYDLASTSNAVVVAPTRQITAFAAGAGPYGLAYDKAHDRLFVSLRGAETIAVFDAASLANGTYLATVDRVIGGAATKLLTPSQIAYDAARDELYVANVDALGTGQVIVFAGASAATGNVAPTRSIDTTGYTSVSGITLDHTRDELYVSTGNQLRIGVYPAASTLTGAALPARTIEGFTQPVSQLAFDPSFE